MKVKMNQVEVLPFSISAQGVGKDKNLISKSGEKEPLPSTCKHGPECFEFGQIIKYPKLLMQIGGVYVSSYCPCRELDSKNVNKDNGDYFKMTGESEMISGNIKKWQEGRVDEEQFDDIEKGLDLNHEIQDAFQEPCLVKVQNTRRKIFFPTEKTDQVKLDTLAIHDLENQQNLKRKDIRLQKSSSKDTRRCPVLDSPCRQRLKILLFVIGLIVKLSDLFRYLLVIVKSYKNESTLVYSLTIFTFLFYQSFLVTTGSQACCNHFKTFMSEFYQYEQKYGLAINAEKIKQRTKIMFIVQMVIHLIEGLICLCGILFFFAEEMLSEMWPFGKPEGQLSYIVAVLGTTTIVLSSSSLYGAKTFRAIVLIVLGEEFANMHDKLLLILTEEERDDIREVKFGSFLTQLQNLNQIKEKIYQLLKHTIASSFIFSLPLLCLVLYGVINGSLRLDQICYMSFTVILCILVIVTTAGGCAAVHIKMSSVWDAIYESSWTNLSTSLLQKLEVFMNQKTVQPLGFSVYEMMIVDRSTFLMIGGSLLTYGIIVVQFNDTQNPTSNQCLGFNDTYGL